MSFLTDLFAEFLSDFASVLSSFEFTRDLSNDIAKLIPYWEKANFLLPVSESLLIFSLFLTLQSVLMAYYWITRTINLIRGAG